MSDDRFDWQNDTSIILRPRFATAIFINADGDICMRQQHWPDDDTSIVIPVEDGEYFASCVDAVARAVAEGKCAHVRGIRSTAAAEAKRDAAEITAERGIGGTQ